MSTKLTLFLVIASICMVRGSSWTISYKGLYLIKRFIPWKPRAYRNSANEWAIGYGTTRYENGQVIRKDDVIAEYRGLQLLRMQLVGFGRKVNAMLGNAKVTQHQFDALLSFGFDLGVQRLRRSTLLFKVRRDNRNPSIRGEFLRHVHVRGVKLPLQMKRRRMEADLYFS